MSTPLVTINLVVLNGGKYIRHCLDAILAQTYPHELIELSILDNGSTDGTVDIIRDLEIRISSLGFARFNFIKSKLNLGMWPGQEELLKYSTGKYIVGVAVDVIVDKDFVKNSVEIMEKDEKIGALQAKIYRYELSELRITNYELPRKVIDTVGFQIYKSRRVTNIGHGQEDTGQFNERKEVFGVEGAVPVFRKSALEACSIEVKPQYYEIFDHDFFWYGDDLDLAWRINIFGFKQIFAPNVIAWHDRQTTKSVKKHWWDYLTRTRQRHQIQIKKRRLDWRNTRFTIIKNDYTINTLKDLPRIVVREIMVLGYSILFEPAVLLEIPNLIKLLPRMFMKRRKIMERRVAKPEEIRKYFL